MTSFPGSPRLIKGGIVLCDPNTGSVQRVIALQYNPETLTRSLQPQTVGGESGDRSDHLRLKAPPVETIKLEAEIDATDQLEFPDQNQNTVDYGIQPQLAVLETMLYPASSKLQSNNTLASLGTLEIVPVPAPLTLFVWSKNRVVPVRLTEFNVTEELFDTSLNPIRAKVTLGMRVMSVGDLGFGSKAATIYLSYQQQKEQLAGKYPSGTMSALGLGGLP
jgi:hypothetical protein